METIYYNLVKNQNDYHPRLAIELHSKGKSNLNKLRPEACPAIYNASSKGIIFFSEEDFSFDENGHSVNIYNTLNVKTGKVGKDIVTPALLGSCEKEVGFYKIGNGLNIQLGNSGALVLPPIDPRFRNINLNYSITYLPPKYCGQLVAAVNPIKRTKICKGDVIGQLVILNECEIRLVENDFENKIQHYENDFKILNSDIIKSNSNEFHLKKK